MAPRPEFSLMERYNGIAQSIVSPTTVMNNVREPKSPNHPRAGRDQRWRPPPSNLPTLKTKVQSASRRRPLGELGTPADSSNPSSVDGRSSGDGKESHRATQWILGDHFNLACANQNVDDLSGSSSNQNVPLPKKNLNMCFDRTATVAGDFAATAAEVYRVECKASNSHAEAGKYGSKAKDARNNFKQRTRSLKDNDKKSLSVSEDNSLARHHSDDELKGRDRDSVLTRKSSHSRSDRDPSGSPSRTDTSDPWLDISPPRVDRTSDVNEFDPQANTLMEAQLEMVQFGHDIPLHSGAKLARAQHDMKLQHKVIDGWKRQLEMTQQRLDNTFAELAQVKKDAQIKQYKATESRAQAVQDRKKLQDMYDKELKRKRVLEDNIAKIQQEVSELKVSLRNSRSSSPRSAPDQSNSNQIIALKAEIAELRLRLAQSHAASFEDLPSTKSMHEVNELKRRLQETEDQLNEFRQKDMDLERIKQDHENCVMALNEKIEQVQAEAQNKHAILEEGLKAAVKEENKVRSELTKCKSNMHRLERERSRHRLHNSADVDRLTKQLASANEQISKLQEEMKEEQKQAKEESNKLKSELACVKENFVEVTKGLARKTTSSMAEKVKLEKQVECLTKEIEALKKVLESKDAIIANQVPRGTEPPDASDDLQQTIDLQATLKSLQEENTELRSKISQARLSTEQGKPDNTKLSAETEDLIATLRKEVVALGGKIEFLERTTRSQEDKILEAKRTEEALKDEVASLKSRLSASEARCTEERLRAEEERRISRENETRHHQELDELKKENEKVIGDKMKLREELEELRKQLAQAGKSMSISVSNGSTDAPSKVNKLRNELALARARLAAAREQTGTVATNSSLSFEKLEDTGSHGSQSLSVCTPEDTVQCTSESIGSTWAPPMNSADDSEGASLKNTTPHQSPKKALPASSPRSAVSLGHKSLFDEDEPEVVSEKSSSSENNEKKVGLSGITRITRNVEELRRQLEESSKRLEKASNRLNGLVDQTSIKQVDVSVPTYQSYHRETISIMTEEDNQSGMTEEVMTSEHGDIEVQCVRFADI